MTVSLSLYKYAGSCIETYSKMYIKVLFTVHLGKLYAFKGMEILYVHKSTKA